MDIFYKEGDATTISIKTYSRFFMPSILVAFYLLNVVWAEIMLGSLKQNVFFGLRK